MPHYLRFAGIVSLAIASQPARAQAIVGNPANWIGPQDYPAEALAKREEGVVNLRFAIRSEEHTSELQSH